MTPQEAWDSLYPKLRASGWVVDRYNGQAVLTNEQVITLTFKKLEKDTP